MQVKISGEAIIHHHNTITEQHWDKVHGNGKTAYMAQPGPSSSVSEPGDGLEYLKNGSADEDGYNNFAVIVTQVNSVEWLQLKDAGHRRAQYKLIDDSWKGQWLIP